MTGKDSTSTWVVTFLDGNKVKSIHPTTFDLESARQFVKFKAVQGVRCSMRRLETNPKETAPAN